MTQSTLSDSPAAPETLHSQVRSAVLWRSGMQIVGQLIAWTSTFLVIRILSPADYGLFAMTQVILVLLNMLNGYGLVSAIIQRPEIDERALRQLFGMLILLNGTLGALQFLAAPLAASYYRHPEVAGLLRVQALLYLATPLVAYPTALLSRRMDFRRQAGVVLTGAVAGAIAALGGALGGLGVWTLVLAPMVLFFTQGIGMMTVARAWTWPSFDFRGAGSMARYGGLMAAGQLFWFVQSQADVFIAGRHLDAHALGIYTTSLFLAQIFVSKFVPPLNEVAFSTYARIQHDPRQAAAAFRTSVGLIMLAALPFYVGLASVAEPLTATVLGPKWVETGPVVATLALAMPFMTLQVLFAPASDARGRPDISAKNGAGGAIVMGLAFLAGVQWGVRGLTLAWVLAYPVYLAISARRTLPVIGVTARQLAATIAVPLLAAIAMGVVVHLIDRVLPAMADLPRLAILIGVGAVTYVGWLATFARPTLRRAVELVRKR